MTRIGSRTTGRPTLAEVARLSGVSPITASRALRGVSTVAPDLVEKVIAAAASLGYVANPAARALASARSQSVVVLIPSLSNQLFIDTLEAIHEVMRPRGLEVLIGNYHYDLAEEENLIRNYLAYQPCGMLLTGFEPFDGDVLNPSWEVARALDGGLVTALRLPCEFGRAKELLWQALDSGRFDVLLSLGLALVIALVIAGATSWALAQKISQFSEHVSAIAEGSYDLALEDSDIRELNTLRRSLEQMVGAIVEREHGMARTAQSLRESEDRLLATLENTPNVAVQWFDPEGRVLLWNHASETLYGIARQDALGKTLDQLFLNPQQARLFLATLREAAKGVALGPYLSDVRNAAGQQLYVQGTTFSIPAPGGGQHFVCMNVDITEQKKAELAYRDLNETLEQRVVLRTDALTQSNLELNQTLATLQQAQNELVRSEKLAALGSLVAGIAHELNTPIGNSVMAASTLEDHSNAMRKAVTEGNLRRSVLEQFIGDTQTAEPHTRCEHA